MPEKKGHDRLLTWPIVGYYHVAFVDGKNNNIPAKFTWTPGERQFCPFKVRTLDSGSYSFSLPKINYFCAHFYKIVKQRIVNWQRYTAKCQRTVFFGTTVYRGSRLLGLSPWVMVNVVHIVSLDRKPAEKAQNPCCVCESDTANGLYRTVQWRTIAYSDECHCTSCRIWTNSFMALILRAYVQQINISYSGLQAFLLSAWSVKHFVQCIFTIYLALRRAIVSK